jgi:hypothetical protein
VSVEPGAEGLSCPSARCEPGSSLIAVLGPEGRLAHVTPELPVDEEFVARASRHGPPEARMRFTSPCVEARCVQWTGSGCGVIEDVIAADLSTGEERRLPRCAIRATCRWYHQEGADACRVCPLILTDVSADGVPAS